MDSKVMPVVLHPHTALRQVCAEVANVDDAVVRLLDGMLATLHAAEGVGLAAPQVNVLRRVIVVEPEVEGGRGARQPKAGSKPLLMVNPVLLEASDEMIDSEEGCLSIPLVYGTLQRYAWVKVGYIDRDGNPREVEGEGLLGRCLQHEIDHLNGVLFFDHLSRLKRDMLLKRYGKIDIAGEVTYPVLRG